MPPPRTNSTEQCGCCAESTTEPKPYGHAHVNVTPDHFYVAISNTLRDTIAGQAPGTIRNNRRIRRGHPSNEGASHGAKEHEGDDDSDEARKVAHGTSSPLPCDANEQFENPGTSVPDMELEAGILIDCESVPCPPLLTFRQHFDERGICGKVVLGERQDGSEPVISPRGALERKHVLACIQAKIPDRFSSESIESPRFNRLEACNSFSDRFVRVGAGGEDDGDDDEARRYVHDELLSVSSGVLRRNRPASYRSASGRSGRMIRSSVSSR